MTPLRYLIGFLLLLSIQVWGQNPSYYIIGQKELSSVDIYSIHQDINKRLYLGTNQGIYYFKNGHFQNMPLPAKANGNSVFGLSEDNAGQIYFCNLSGQIFRIVDQHIELFTTLKDAEQSSFLSFELTNYNTIIVESKNINEISLQDPQNKKMLFDGGNYGLKKLPDGKIIFTAIEENKIKQISNGVVGNLSTNNSFNGNYTSTIKLSGKYININGEKYKDLSHFSKNISPVNFNNSSFYQKNDLEAWAISNSNGLRLVSLNNHKLKTSKLLFGNYFISKMHQGINGTLFLGTFGKGVIVIPDNKTIKYDENLSNVSLRGIAVDRDDNAYISTREGKILLINKGIRNINKNNYVLENIFYADGIDFGINHQNKSLLYDNPYNLKGLSPYIGVLKDIYQIDKENVLIATSSGIYKLGPNYSNEQWTKLPSPFLLEKFNPINVRCRSIAYDTTTNTLFVSTNSSLLAFNKSHKQALTLHNQNVNVNELCIYKNKLYCATQKNGILVFENNKLIYQYTDKDGINEPYIIKILIQDSLLYVAHKSGFQIFGLEDQQHYTLGSANGIINGSIIDFDVSKKYLWMIAPDGVYKRKLNELKQPTPDLQVHVDSFYFKSNKGVYSTAKDIPYDINQLNVHFDFNDIEYLDETKISYRVRGLEKEWRETNYKEQKIQYKYLPPGNYTFEIKTTYRDSEKLSFSRNFNIKKPFWLTWFFFFVSNILFIAFVYTIIKYFMDENQKKQAHKHALNLSKMTALKSQMNPHFIFNALNSIQALVLKGDIEASYRYITKFANLVRSTLNYSDKNFIPFEDEIKLIELYLSLEKLRFKDNFEYKISIDVPNNIVVPPLMIQPIIENALRHGLLHKEGPKKLDIIISLKKHLECRVIDNGVGRQRATEISLRQNKAYVSFSISALKKRYQLLTAEFGEEYGFKIIDLYDINTPIGTKVILDLPFKFV